MYKGWIGTNTRYRKGIMQENTNFWWGYEGGGGGNKFVACTHFPYDTL
jgi:hypothetical protein